MSDKIKAESVAIINIGAGEIRMRIAEKTSQGINVLDSLKYPLNLAKDTFSLGSIGFDKANIICDVLSNYITVCKEYGIKTIKPVATTVVREASNKEYIIDQIKVKTGLDVKIIDDNMEKLYIFKLTDSHIRSGGFSDAFFMSHISSGSVGIGYSKGGAISFTKNLKIGTLRILELFERMHDNSIEFYVLIEEFLDSFLRDLRFETADIAGNLVISGSDAQTVARLCGSELDNSMYSVERSCFIKLYNDVKYKNSDVLVNEYGIPEDKADTLLPAMCIYNRLLEFTDSETITIPVISLEDALAYEHLFPQEFSDINKAFANNTIVSAKRIASKYMIDEDHYNYTLNLADKIFENMKKVHGMGRRNNLLLKTAAILHDCGKFVNISDHHIHSYNLIKGSDITGLDFDETDIVANIALYHSQIAPMQTDENYRELKPSKKVLVSKLAAILRLADALDRSRKQKLTDINVSLTKAQLIITAKSSQNVELEQWAFYEKGEFFEKVFGIAPVLKVKSPI